MNGKPLASNTQDIVFVTVLCFGTFIFASIRAVALGFPVKPFTDAAFFEIVATELLLGTAALAYLRLRGYGLGLLKITPTVMGSLAGAFLLVLGSIVGATLAYLVARGDASAQPIAQMVARATVSPVPLVAVCIINGLYEETFLCGYLQRALASHGAAFAIGASLLVRTSYHLYQGPAGAVSVLGFGLVLSLYFQRTRKLWPIAFAHMLTDALGFALA